jgi:hypothetical protein
MIPLNPAAQEQKQPRYAVTIVHTAQRAEVGCYAIPPG